MELKFYIWFYGFVIAYTFLIYIYIYRAKKSIALTHLEHRDVSQLILVLEILHPEIDPLAIEHNLQIIQQQQLKLIRIAVNRFLHRKYLLCELLP